MPNIQDLGYPLGYKVDRASVPDLTVPSGSRDEGQVSVHVFGRGLEWMQKEAVVTVSPNSVWRLVSDEGPYLRGTDLAPFPLGFFSAGMQFSLMAELQRHAQQQGVLLETIEVVQHNTYAMSGTVSKGDMLASAYPVEILVRLRTSAPRHVVHDLVRRAETSSPPHALMRESLRQNTFSLVCNGRVVPLTTVNPSSGSVAPDPLQAFETLAPTPEEEYRPEILSKVAAAEVVVGVEGGAGSSLKDDQRRVVRIYSEGRILENGLMEVVVHLRSPIGSSFRFLSEDPALTGGSETAPPPLAFPMTSVAFCYMTQVGRYARITRQDLQAMRIVQQCAFRWEKAADGYERVIPSPVDTHVYLEGDLSDEAAENLVRMGERTCYLHASMKATLPSVITVELNGERMSP